MEGLEILRGREHVEPKLLMRADPSLARIMGHLNLCVCFSGILDGKNVAACLLSEHNDGICDVVNFSIDESSHDNGLEKAMLLHVMDYAREKGFSHMEIGVGNAYLDMHGMLLKMGFRIIGVTPDYYQADGKSMVVENSIVNRDMIRYRVTF